MAPASQAGAAEVVGAVDIDRGALEIYARNFSHPRRVALLESLSADPLEAFEADLWWASPPCQPFTRRGLGRDLDDPRAATFRALVERVDAVRPRYLALENVAPFSTSRARDLLLGVLERAGYAQIDERVLCPSALGQPNSRPRYYLLASRDGVLLGRSDAARPMRPLADFLEDPLPSVPLLLDPLLLNPDVARRYRGALHVVRADAAPEDAVTTCFTSAYGRSPVRSGSYLETERGPRYFSPTEVLRLLGFAPGFELPRAEAARKRLWRLAGNSLSIPAVRHVLEAIPELREAMLAARGSFR